MDQWQVDRRDDPFEVLARSGGVLATDGIELAEYRTNDDPLTVPLRIRVAGLRHYPGRVTAEENTHVSLVLDPSNAHDKDAVKIVLNDGAALGYVPRCYAPLIRDHLIRGDNLEAVLRRPVVLADDPKRWQLEVHRVA